MLWVMTLCLTLLSCARWGSGAQVFQDLPNNQVAVVSYAMPPRVSYSGCLCGTNSRGVTCMGAGERYGECFCFQVVHGTLFVDVYVDSRQPRSGPARSKRCPTAV